MQEKIIHIPFNRTLFMAGRRNLWELSVKKHYLSYTIYTAVALFCLIMGIKLETKGEFPIGQIIGGGLLFSMCLQWVNLIERRARYLKIANKAGDRFEKETMAAPIFLTTTVLNTRTKKSYSGLNGTFLNPYL